jgi:hypothetical protein
MMQDQNHSESITLSVIEMARAGQFAEIRDKFLPALRDSVAPEVLQAAWQAEIGRVGPVVNIGQPSRQTTPTGLQVVTVTGQCEKGTITLIALVDQDGYLNGLDLRSSEVQSNMDHFTEETIDIGQEPWKLPATLTIPRGNGPYPAVVLVHGSGPNDRDESIGPNKPFLDLAWGLALRQIVVLRYEKRTRVYADPCEDPTQFTVEDETIDDVGAAMDALQRVDKVDATKIFALGHSLGGYVMPRILEKFPKLAGGVFLAASYRPLPVVMEEQIQYILALPETTDQAKESLLAMKAEIPKITALSTHDPRVDAPRPMGVPVSYWRDLAEYNPGEVLQSIDRRMFVLQGEADYQVTLDDFHLWQDAAQRMPKVVFKRYPNLDHLFMLTEEDRATPATYTRPRQVSSQVIEDIANWLTNSYR